MIPNWKLHGQGYCTWEYGKLLSLYIFVRGFQGSWYFAWSWSRKIQVTPGNPAKFTITFKIPRNSGEFLSNTRWYNIFEAFFLDLRPSIVQLWSLEHNARIIESQLPMTRILKTHPMKRGGVGGGYSVQCHTEIDLQTACFQTHITLSSLVNTPDSPAW